MPRTFRRRRQHDLHTLVLHVQPDRVADFDMPRLRSLLTEIASDNVVSEHAFDNGYEDGPYFNYRFQTRNRAMLWKLIQRRVYGDDYWGPKLTQACIATCTGEDGWNDYLLLSHFDAAEKLDKIPYPR